MHNTIANLLFGISPSVYVTHHISPANSIALLDVGGEEAELAFDGVMTGQNTDAAEMLRAMRAFLRENDMMAYLAMVAVRLLELRRVLKPTGSLHLLAATLEIDDQDVVPCSAWTTAKRQVSLGEDAAHLGRDINGRSLREKGRISSPRCVLCLSCWSLQLR
jgi:hypothetical protein